MSGTTRELTIGAGIQFVDRGIRSFKGISEDRPVYEAQLRVADTGAIPTDQGR